MLKIVVISVLFLLSFAGKSQIVSQTSDNNLDSTHVQTHDDPSFPGGYEAMQHFLKDNYNYSDSLMNMGVQGKVYVKFVVEASGELTNIEVIRGLHPLADAEALRVFKLMPNWIPGQRNGKPVSMKMSLPVILRLQ